MNNVVIKTGIKISRNLKKYPFPCRLSSMQKEKLASEIIEVVKSINSPLTAEFEAIWLKDLSEPQRISLVESQLASPEFVSQTEGRAIIISKDRKVSVMLNEEDHICLQVLCDGDSLNEAYDLADRLDTLFDEKLGFAFDEKLGYLTQRPTNLGTGMRAFVMLHLPALKAGKAVGRIAGNLQKLGLTIRGVNDELSEPKGAFYKLSNQVTLGISEQSAIENLKNISEQLKSQELAAQQRMVKNIEAQDKLSRSLGILRTAKIISCDEAMELLSNVRFGVNAGVIDGVEISTVDNLIRRIRPATMMVEKNEQIPPRDRDILRAEIIQQEL